jgi:hypothetical protein
VTKWSRLGTLALLLAFLAACGGSKSIGGGEMQEIANVKYEGDFDAVAVDRSGGVLVAWNDDHGAYERYAPPGTGWSSTKSFAPEEADGLAYGSSLGFDGRGERLAVWGAERWRSDIDLIFDVRRPGDERTLMRAPARLPDGYLPIKGVSVIGSPSCGFLVTVAGERETKNGDRYYASFAYLVRCAPRWHLVPVQNEVGFRGRVRRARPTNAFLVGLSFSQRT